MVRSPALTGTQGEAQVCVCLDLQTAQFVSLIFSRTKTIHRSSCNIVVMCVCVGVVCVCWCVYVCWCVCVCVCVRVFCICGLSKVLFKVHTVTTCSIRTTNSNTIISIYQFKCKCVGKCGACDISIVVNVSCYLLL